MISYLGDIALVTELINNVFTNKYLGLSTQSKYLKSKLKIKYLKLST